MSDQTIMIIRHAEKPLPGHTARGITHSGRPDKRSLTVDGWQRAGALIDLLAPARGLPPAGLRRPDAIYGSAAMHGRSKRAIETVKPLADRLGIPVVDRFAPGDEAKLAEELIARPGVSLVSWHHKSISKIIEHLGAVKPAAPARWPEDRYDMVWTLTRDGDGWRFEQVPQLLLAGDLPEPIAA
jgi:broad specificity phosphatase PhoE